MAQRSLSNPKRGCGHLKRGKAYIRGTIGSPDGVLPSFVKCDPPIPYREMGTEGGITRGYIEFDGLTSQIALESITDFVRLYPGDADDEQAVRNMIDRGLYPEPSTHSVTGDGHVPEREADRHVDRIRAAGTRGETHFGAVDAVRQSDVMMRAGKTHYPEPEDFIQEAVEMGISKAIPVSKRQEPPVIDPGTTRCWIIHPDTSDGWAVIGYAYLQEVVYTEPEDGNVPEYVQEYHDAGRLDVVDIDPPTSDAGENETLGDVADAIRNGDRRPDGSTPDDADADDADSTDDSADTVVPDESGAAGRDVQDAAQAILDADDITYNDMKAASVDPNVDVGQHPGKAGLADALAAAGWTPADLRHDPDIQPDE